MRRLNKKLVVLMAVILVFSSTLVSGVFAADTIVNLKGFFSTAIKVTSNGQQVSLGIDDVSGKPYQPLVVDSRTYIPIRALANVLGKEVDWNQGTSTISINDKPDANYSNLVYQVLEKQEQIKKLEDRVKTLEAELAANKTSKPTTTSELQKYLNNEYGVYESIDFEIVVSGSTSKTTLKIYVDKGDNTRWGKLSSSNVKKYVENIVDDVEEYFPKTSVSGYIINDYNDRTEVKFYVNTSGKLIIDTDYYSGSGSGSLSDLEDDLNYYYGTYRSTSFEISLYGDKNDIEVEVYVDEDDWFDYLDQEDREIYLEKLYDEIIDEFPNAEIYGSVYDDYYNSNYRIGSFTFSPSGYVYLKNYY